MDHYHSFCGDTTAPHAPDLVYSFTVLKEGTMTLTLTAPIGSTLVPALYIRNDCNTDLNCVSDGGSVETYVADVLPGTYYAIVDGQKGTAGTFTLTASLVAAKCGDGIIETGEDCDPGPPVVPNDGCGAPGTPNECKFIPAPIGEDKCPGQPISISPGTNQLVASIAQGTSLYGFKDDYIGSCSLYSGGLDRVFQLTPMMTGTMKVSVGFEADGITESCAADMFAAKCMGHLIYARSVCTDATKEIPGSCIENGMDPSHSTTMTLAVTSGVPVWVIVDGYDNQNYSYGPFNLHVSLQ
jgi:cysteine-rich repeat protein